MPVQWKRGRIRNIQPLTSETWEFEIEIQKSDAFDYQPGQFITMDLPIGEKRLDRWRSYSIAGNPDKSGQLVFCIGKVPGGRASRYLFETLSLGEEINFKGPEGNFTLPADLDREIIMICTGTGVAPFRSMIRHVLSNRIPFRSIHLIFGTRFEKNVLYKEEFELFAQQNKSFNYSIALSREQVPGTHFGYVHDLYTQTYENSEKDRLFMICGWKGMIDEAVLNLGTRLGYHSSQIKYELYG
jgi:ferredoxin-NADP reductase